MAQPQLSDLDFASQARITNLLDAVSAQEPATLAQLNALGQSLSWKDAVRVASTANVTVSNPGTATFDGVTIGNGDPILLKDQTSQPENGLWVFNGSGVALTRRADADVFSELEGAVVMVEEGTTNGNTRWKQTQVNGVIGTNNIVWINDTSSAPAATETVSGIAEIATQAETNAGTDDARIVTPLKLANHSNRKLKFAANVGDGTATSITVTHNLNTEDVHVQVYRNSGSKETIGVEVRRTSVNAVQLVFAVAPTANQHRCVVLG